MKERCKSETMWILKGRQLSVNVKSVVENYTMVGLRMKNL